MNLVYGMVYQNIDTWAHVGGFVGICMYACINICMYACLYMHCIIFCVILSVWSRWSASIAGADSQRATGKVGLDMYVCMYATMGMYICMYVS